VSNSSCTQNTNPGIDQSFHRIPEGDQMIQQVRISVGNTWSARTADEEAAATVALDLTGYRDQLNQLKDNPQTSDAFRLPWPAYPSTLWKWMFGGRYDNIPTREMVSALLPLRREEKIGVVPGTGGAATLEAYWHPFAVTGIVHVQMLETDLADPSSAARAVDELLRQPVGATGSLLREGIGLEQLPRSITDADGHNMQYRPGGTFCVLSGLHPDAEDPLTLATQLATLFEGVSQPGLPLRTAGGAIAVRGANAGLVLSRNQIRAGRRLKCLHHNTVVLLAIMQNLLTLFTGPGSIAWQAYPKLAAPLLNGLYRRVPPPGATSIYRSRIAELWLQKSNLVDAINLANASLPNPPPAIRP
jgi:hypothetical protein